MGAQATAARVVLYFSQWGTPMYTHEKATLTKVAETIAELKGSEFDGEFDPARHASGKIYFIPDDTLMQDEALQMGIRSASALYGGVVPRCVYRKPYSHCLAERIA